ncbi:hypothetical protein RJT34_30874 [Clitoria ternatea]|uniref:Uncharacterized protein n=1 Tax=Clitoria ternatea TaxID=43366 RepID=A0AAN9I2D9_CLITE
MDVQDSTKKEERRPPPPLPSASLPPDRRLWHRSSSSDRQHRSRLPLDEPSPDRAYPTDQDPFGLLLHRSDPSTREQNRLPAAGHHRDSPLLVSERRPHGAAFWNSHGLVHVEAANFVDGAFKESKVARSYDVHTHPTNYASSSTDNNPFVPKLDMSPFHLPRKRYWEREFKWGKRKAFALFTVGAFAGSMLPRLEISKEQIIHM